MGPVGHSMSGLAGYYGICLVGRRRPIRWMVAGAVFLANLPDFDLIPILWDGLSQGGWFHHSYTHTFMFAGLAGVLAGIGMWVYSGTWRWSFAAGVAFIVSLHIIGDYFTRDTGYPYGEMLWWPFSSTYHIGPTVFPDIYKGSWNTLFSSANLNACIHEFLVFTPILSWMVFLVYDETSSTGTREI